MPGAETRLGTLIAGIEPRRRKAWRAYLETLAAQLAAIECDLAALPPESWRALRHNILSQIDRRQPARGWAQARDLLHEARAWRYLAELGCTEIAFCPTGTAAKSPDLIAALGTRRVLCEVKTVRLRGADELPATFVRKLKARLIDAERQLAANGDETAWRLIYLILDGKDFAPNDPLAAMIVDILRNSMPAGLTLAIDLSGRVTEIN